MCYHTGGIFYLVVKGLLQAFTYLDLRVLDLRMLRLKLFHSGEEYKQSNDNAGDPTDGPNQVQEGQVGYQGEHHIHPEETESAHKDQGGDGGHHRSSHTPQSGGKHIVDTADKVGAGDQDHFLAGIFDHCGIIRHKAG